ncbi:SDR family oxidoreductase [Enterobacteriaceae endosymbiont of Donacia versicolorea]|uniref:enoyl-ACP reductase FabI n=1 Tax=Enterobacteriaceae endosymbiont of Donacia versicolorea TaxID=2675788 RepID=UPI0014494ED0|nr:SDR family oxidoreductase [Enterobacteriaceae endosymbiont of Donacia versicolorea]QJC31953.1 SDR family oxidoreductase [Enterobacteriaceae endosymbiont of Donacia versicolorea]
MNLLFGKKILITGILNKKSIAYGIAQVMYKNKANLIFTYQEKKNKNKIEKLVKKMTKYPIIKCNVSKDKDIKFLFLKISKIWNKFDGFVYAIAFASFNTLKNNFIKNISRTEFQISHDISSYSLLGMIKKCLHLLNSKSSIIVLTYLGAQKFIPNYNIMGLAKASLEANIRYIACNIGNKNIRINGISPAPIKTIASSKIKNINNIIKLYKKNSPLSEKITINHIGNVATFLASDLSLGITGEIINLDSGFSIQIIGNN